MTIEEIFPRADREAAQRRAKAATAGPWKAVHSIQLFDEILKAIADMLAKGGGVTFWVDSSITHPDDTEPMVVAFLGNGPAGESNSIAIAAARTDLPRALAALDAAEDRIAELEKQWTERDGKTKVLDEPPVCDCCKRCVRETTSRPMLLGCDAMLCRDCFFAWYDGAGSIVGTDGADPEKIRDYVLRKHGERGGEADLAGKPKTIAEELRGLTP